MAEIESLAMPDSSNKYCQEMIHDGDPLHSSLDM